MSQKAFVAEDCLNQIRHYLPTQAPLKDFIHHNTLHAFQKRNFFHALQDASEIFGNHTCLTLQQYRKLYRNGKIDVFQLDASIERNKGEFTSAELKDKLLTFDPDLTYRKRIGKLRANWQNHYGFDPGQEVHSLLFKLTSSFLDQGISAGMKYSSEKGLVDAIAEIQENSLIKIVRSPRAESFLYNDNREISSLLNLLIGNQFWYEQYLIDQQFEHPGWSGMVSVLESKPSLLFLPKKVSYSDFVYLELLLELDVLDRKFGEGKWKPLAEVVDFVPEDVFRPSEVDLSWVLKKTWQEAFELTYFDQVLKGIQSSVDHKKTSVRSSFQAFFCIDDREESLRRHIEAADPDCETYSTPAHFNLPIYYRPAGGKFNTQVCPAPMSPKHIIVDDRDSERNKKDLHFSQHSHGFFGGWLIAQTLGFWSAIKLFLNVMKPAVSPAQSSSFEHMSHRSKLIIEHKGQFEGSLQVGFTFEEMVNLVEQELKRCGLTQGFAPLVYFFGHGGSSTNNPYYAGYNCGACSGKPSSLNARVFAAIANRSDVRDELENRGINIESKTWFIGGLHDTTRDEFVYYDLDKLDNDHRELHEEYLITFQKALTANAKERARQFMSVDLSAPPYLAHKKVKMRSTALFEPRPELNHSNNCLCIVGRRSLTKHLFLDQRAFLNSYDYRKDPTGQNLLTILQAATPVCGGINLEYYFSRVDNENFGSGSKLPHNVVGLFGLSNGVEGDLRTGLPLQMIEVHDPLRLMMIVEQKPDLILQALDQNPLMKEWYVNDWIKLACIDPETNIIYIYAGGLFSTYLPQYNLEKVSDLEKMFESTCENLPVSILV